MLISLLQGTGGMPENLEHTLMATRSGENVSTLHPARNWSTQEEKRLSDGLTERLRAACGSKHTSEIARMTDWNRETIRRYLSGQRPDIEFLARFAKVMGVSMDWLVLGTGPVLPARESDDDSEVPATRRAG